MTEYIEALWTTKTCGPCKGLKEWVSSHFPTLPIKDAHEETPPANMRGVPTLVIQTEKTELLVTGVEEIKNYLDTCAEYNAANWKGANV